MASETAVATGPILTHEQGGRLWRAITTWLEVVRRETGEYPAFSEVNIRKSCLLGRLIYEGKDPLPDPPPTAYSAPWYDLIESGRAFFLRDAFVGEHGGAVYLGQCQWQVVERCEDGSLVLEFPKNGRWRLRPVTDDDPQHESGKTRVGDAWLPIYADTVLERIK